MRRARDAHPHAPRAARQAALIAALLAAAGCGDATRPPARVPLRPNTMSIKVDGALQLDEVVKTVAGYQHVTTGEDEGAHVQGEASNGFPLVIRVPGKLSTGRHPIVRWDPSRHYLRHVSVPFVGRRPSINFGSGIAVAFG